MTTHDKHGNELKRGDHVEVVHFGDHHAFTIEHIHTGEEGQPHHVSGQITITVPAAAVTRREKRAESKEQRDLTPHSSSPTTHNKAGAPTSHTPVQHPQKQRILRGRAKKS